MKDHMFDHLIRSERDRPLPQCPPNLESNVLRRVRLAQSESAAPAADLDWLLGLFPRRGVAFGALALVLFLSTSASVFVASRHTSATGDGQRIAASSLDFGVFQQTHVINLD